MGFQWVWVCFKVTTYHDSAQMTNTPPLSSVYRHWIQMDLSQIWPGHPAREHCYDSALLCRTAIWEEDEEVNRGADEAER